LQELKWSNAEKQRQLQEAIVFLKTQMGKDVNRTSRENIPINLTKEEMSKYVKRFNAIDREKKGYITVTDMTRSMKVGVATLLHEVLAVALNIFRAVFT
jgi:glycerol-3-phosphate dehydrogenase